MKDVYQTLKKLLEAVDNPYPSFVENTISELKHYEDRNPKAAEQLIELLESRKDLDASQVSVYETSLIGIPLPDENGDFIRWGKIISEEEAQRILETEYCE